MSVAHITSLRLDAFKSFRGQELPLGDLTILTGRNSSGKSNALDGLEVLSRLATGEELGDALDGTRREAGAVRGGSSGCAPHGSDSFAIGCSVSVGDETFDYDVEIQVSPELRVRREHLRGPAPAVKSGNVQNRDLVITRRPSTDSMGVEAEVYNGKRGGNPSTIYRDSRLVLTQIPVRLVPRNAADRAVLRAIDAVTSSLKGVFHLDPVPHLMRTYVPERDTELRRTGQNLSASIAALKTNDKERYEEVLQLLRDVADTEIHDIRAVLSPLGDVMLALEEGHGASEVTPAREMSDGLLRFLAIATALMTAQHGLDIDSEDDVSSLPGAPSPVQGAVCIVVEEIENGLHPSQADRVLTLVKRSSKEYGSRVVVTTHSPALLNAMTGSHNENIIVCFRGKDGGSRLARMTDLPGYAHALAEGRVGDLVSRNRLVRPEEPAPDWAEFDELIGLR
ncbi:MAG: AAA family ATPase [Actinomycetales bacterium]